MPGGRAGHRDAPHGQQFLEVQLQADAEHQQDDADFRKLLGQGGVGQEPGVFGPTATPASR